MSPSSNSKNASRVVVVTGASRGIGFAISKAFAAAGDQVIGVARSTQAMRDAGFFSDVIECDVADRERVKEAVASVQARFGAIDVLVNNAGVAGENSLSPDDDDRFWHEIIDVNLNGTYYFSKYATNAMADGGSIINLSSVLGLVGVPDQTAYCAAKHAVIGFTRALALKLASRKIRVNAICPGWTRTEMAHGRIKELGLSDEEFRKSIPLGRFVEPEEVADFAVFLASERAKMITGQALPIDGGSG